VCSRHVYLPNIPNFLGVSRKSVQSNMSVLLIKIHKQPPTSQLNFISLLTSRDDSGKTIITQIHNTPTQWRQWHTPTFKLLSVPPWMYVSFFAFNGSTKEGNLQNTTSFQTSRDAAP